MQICVFLVKKYILLFIKYLLSIIYMSGTVTVTGFTMINKTKMVSIFRYLNI